VERKHLCLALSSLLPPTLPLSSVLCKKNYPFHCSPSLSFVSAPPFITPSIYHTTTTNSEGGEIQKREKERENDKKEMVFKIVKILFIHK